MRRLRLLDKLLSHLFLGLILVSACSSIIGMIFLHAEWGSDEAAELDFLISSICGGLILVLLLTQVIIDIVHTAKMERIRQEMIKKSKQLQPSKEEMAKLFEALAKEFKEEHEKDNG